MMFTPHSSRITATDSQFNFDDSTLTEALKGCENLYAITEIDETSLTISGSSTRQIDYAWDTSLGTFSSTNKSTYIQTGFIILANGDPISQSAQGGWSGGSDGNGNITGTSGVAKQLRKKGSVVGTNGRVVSIGNDVATGYEGYWDDAMASQLSYQIFSSLDGDIFVNNAWFDDDGVSIIFENADTVTRTLDVSGYAYGFC